jgi:hypothetical protein
LRKRRSTRLVVAPLVLACLGLLFVLRSWGLGEAAYSNTVDSTRVVPEGRPPEALEVRSFLTQEWGVAHPTGLAHLPADGSLLVAEARGRATEVLRLSPEEERLGMTRLPMISRPATLAFDRAGGRLTAISGQRLLEVAKEKLREARPPVRRIPIAGVGLQAPAGASFDPATGTWFVLDNGAPAIVSVPMARGVPGTPTALSLRGLGGTRLRGLAFDPGRGLFYVANPQQRLLYGIDSSGAVRQTYGLRGVELGGVGLRDVRALVFAPSSDPTDHPGARHLFIADAGGPSTFGGVAEVTLDAAP